MNSRVPIVLLIEHEAILSVTLARALKDGGYSVIPARHAHDALETFVTHHQDIALVLADTQCTTFAGPPLLVALNMIDPRVPVIAMSPDAASAPRAEDYPNVAATLTGPIDRAEFLVHVQRALEAPPRNQPSESPAGSGTAADQARWGAGPVPSLGERAFGYGGVPFSWPPTEDDLDDIQVLDTHSPLPPEALRPPQWTRNLNVAATATPAQFVAPVEPALPEPFVAPVQPAPPIRLVARKSEPRRRKLEFMRSERWVAVAATVLGGLTLTTLLEVRGVPLKRAGMGDDVPAAAVAPALSARRLQTSTMRLVPAERVPSRMTARIEPPVDARIDSPIDATIDSRIDTPIAPKIDSRVETRIEPQSREPIRTAALPAPAARLASPPVAPPIDPVRPLEPAPPPAPAVASASASAPASAPASEVVAAANVPAAAPARAREDERSIYQVLQQYERAYEELDVNAARAVWPSLNTRALARAFDGLKAQALEFSHCRVAMESLEATAICGGRASYVPRVGRQTERTEPREWTFRLRKVDQEWLIAKAEVK